MFRLLIVEDEPWIRKSLEKILPWNELGIEYTGYARNGEEAFGMIVNAKIDIVITDIKMPKMDGLTLLDKLAEHLTVTPKYMIISGYDDFQYAKHAIKQGVMDYILKPIDPKEVKASILKIIEKLNTEQIERNGLHKLRMKDYVYERIIHPAGEVNYELFPENSHYCLLFSISPIYQELTEKLNTREVTCFSLPFGVYNLYVLISSSEETMSDIFVNVIEEIRQNYLIGSSQIRTGKDHTFYQAFKETEMNYLLHDNHSSVSKIHILKDITLSNKDEADFLDALQAKDKPKVLDKIKQILSTYEFFEQQWVIHFQLYLFLGKYLSGSNSGLPEQVLWLHELKNIKTTRELELWQQKALEPAIDALLKIGQKSAVNYFSQAKKYVEDHYLNASLSLEAVAIHLNLSAPYLSNIFKNMGENFTSYVTRKRIEKAKELLNSPGMTINEISQAVGFNDSKYFIHVFKKETLNTPNHYRKFEK